MIKMLSYVRSKSDYNVIIMYLKSLKWQEARNKIPQNTLAFYPSKSPQSKYLNDILMTF